MRRREFITLLGGAAAWPRAARAQQAEPPMVGFVSAAAPDASYATALRQGLAESGYADGRNVVVELRWAEGRFDRLPVLVSDLMQRRAAVIVTGGLTSALAVSRRLRAFRLSFSAPMTR